MDATSLESEHLESLDYQGAPQLEGYQGDNYFIQDHNNSKVIVRWSQISYQECVLVSVWLANSLTNPLNKSQFEDGLIKVKTEREMCGWEPGLIKTEGKCQHLSISKTFAPSSMLQYSLLQIVSTCYSRISHTLSTMAMGDFMLIALQLGFKIRHKKAYF